MDDNGDKRHNIDALCCVNCGRRRVLLLRSNSRVTIKCGCCDYVFAVVKFTMTENGPRPFVREVMGLPPFLLALV